jgi:TolB-like protein/DNA-binding SARP family transcriptional activator/Flp pilus assembly protein TadD
MPHLYARLLGGLEICGSDGSELKLATRKARALFAFLAIEADKWHTRERLAGLLWSDRQQSQARHSLTQALGAIRRAGEQADLNLLETEGERVRIPSQAVQADVLFLRENMVKDPVAVAAYLKGPFLDGFLSGDEAFDDWSATERLVIQQQAANALDAGSKKLALEGDAAKALTLARQWIAIEPLSEAAHRRVMRLLFDAGDRTGAIQQYQACAQLLRNELGIEPSPETTDFLETIRLGPADMARSSSQKGTIQTDSDPAATNSTPPGEDQGAPTNNASHDPIFAVDVSRPAVAVLPFKNLSLDPEHEFLAVGMSEDLISGLSKFPWLFVIANASMMTFKGQQSDPRHVASELGVRYVVEGSLRVAGQRIRVSARLTDTEPGRHMWSEHYDRDVHDIFAVQDEVTEALIREIAPEIETAESNRVNRIPPNNLDAWGNYQKGLMLANSGSLDELEQCVQVFDKATELDPLFADAIAMAAYTRLRIVYFFKPDNFHELIESSKPRVQKALRLNPNGTLGLLAKARLHALLGEHDLAIEAGLRAVTSNVNCAQAHRELGVAYSGVENFEAGLKHYEQLMLLSPKDPGISASYAGTAYHLFQLGRYEECVEAARSSLRNPNPRYWADLTLIAALQKLDRQSELEAAKDALFRRKPDVSLVALAQTANHSKGDLIETLRAAGLPEQPRTFEAERPSIAVLPFVNLSPAADNEFLADGIADDVITGLSKFKSLFVIARSSSFSFKGRSIDVRQIASDFGVRYVVEGSLRVAGSRVRVSGQLVDAETGKHIWADRFDESLEDLFEIQDQITNAIIRAVEPEIGRAERDRARRTPPNSIDAWVQYQRGLDAYFSTVEDDLLAAAELFEAVNKLDPNFAPAYAMAADTRSRLVVHYRSDNAEKLLAEAERLAARALELQPHDAVGYWSDGRVKCMQRRFQEAIPQLEKAISLNPNHAMAFHALGYTCANAGQADRALEVQDQAIRISPQDAFLGGFLAIKGDALLQLGRFEEAEAVARQALRTPNPRYWIYAQLAIALAETGQQVEAQETASQLFNLKQDFLEHVARLELPGLKVYSEMFEKHGLNGTKGT